MPVLVNLSCKNFGLVVADWRSFHRAPCLLFPHQLTTQSTGWRSGIKFWGRRPWQQNSHATRLCIRSFMFLSSDLRSTSRSSSSFVLYYRSIRFSRVPPTKLCVQALFLCPYRLNIQTFVHFVNCIIVSLFAKQTAGRHWALRGDGTFDWGKWRDEMQSSHVWLRL